MGAYTHKFRVCGCCADDGGRAEGRDRRESLESYVHFDALRSRSRLSSSSSSSSSSSAAAAAKARKRQTRRFVRGCRRVLVIGVHAGAMIRSNLGEVSLIFFASSYFAL